jgi:hypothetical protein
VLVGYEIRKSRQSPNAKIQTEPAKLAISVINQQWFLNHKSKLRTVFRYPIVALAATRTLLKMDTSGLE